MDVSIDLLFNMIGKYHIESMVLREQVANLQNSLAASQEQVRLLMEQSGKPESKPGEG